MDTGEQAYLVIHTLTAVLHNQLWHELEFLGGVRQDSNRCILNKLEKLAENKAIQLSSLNDTKASTNVSASLLIPLGIFPNSTYILVDHIFQVKYHNMILITQVNSRRK